MEIPEKCVKSDVILVSLMLTLNRFHLSDVSIIDFEQVNNGWKVIL